MNGCIYVSIDWIRLFMVLASREMTVIILVF